MIFLCSWFSACHEVDQTQLQQKYLEDKIEDYKDYKWRNCMKEIMKKAEAKSDSFFVATLIKKQEKDTPANQSTSDSIN